MSVKVVNRDISNGIGNAFNSFEPYFRFTIDRGKGPDSLLTSFGFTVNFASVFGSS